MFAYLWVQAGFSMVIIAAGLAAIPRDVLEAARTDGGTEWQVFRRVTVPLLAARAHGRAGHADHQRAQALRPDPRHRPGAEPPRRDDARLRDVAPLAFSGQNLFGLGAAIATFLFVLFVPLLMVNIRRFRGGTLMAAQAVERRRGGARASGEAAGSRSSALGRVGPVRLVLLADRPLLAAATLGLFITSLLLPEEHAGEAAGGTSSSSPERPGRSRTTATCSTTRGSRRRS